MDKKNYVMRALLPSPAEFVARHLERLPAIGLSNSYFWKHALSVSANILYDF